MSGKEIVGVVVFALFGIIPLCYVIIVGIRLGFVFWEKSKRKGPYD